MKDLLRPDSRIRLAIILCLSLCVHMAVLFALSWSSLGARQIAQRDRVRPLTVMLPNPAPAPAPEKAPAEKPAAQGSADADQTGSKFALSQQGLPLPIDQHFFSLAELDERPFVIQDIPGDPPELRNFPQGGRLVLRLWIDKGGEVINAESVSSELPQAFIDSAREGFLKARFAPGRKLGVAVDSVMDVVLLYAPAK